LRFLETDVRSMGRTAAGVSAIKLAAGDRLVAMDTVEEDACLVVVSAKGYAKRTALSEYPTQSRYGRGVVTFSGSEDDTGPLAACCVAAEGDSLEINLSSGAASRITASDIALQGRATRGSQIVEPKAKDAVSGLVRLAASPRPRRAATGSRSKPKTSKTPSSRRRSSTKSTSSIRKRSTSASKRSSSTTKPRSGSRSRKRAKKS
jgi:DNA gyrase subunit A